MQLAIFFFFFEYPQILFWLELLKLIFLSLSLSLSPPLCQDARQKFRSILVEATGKLDELVKKIGKAVEDSKPYWEARRLARQVSLQTLEIYGASAKHYLLMWPAFTLKDDFNSSSCTFPNCLVFVTQHSSKPSNPCKVFIQFEYFHSTATCCSTETASKTGWFIWRPFILMNNLVQ